MATILKLKFVSLFIFLLFYHEIASFENNYIKPDSVKMIKSDVPSFIDLMVYIPLLNRIVDFCEQNKNILSINLVHGLFLLNVNLDQFLTDDSIHEAIRKYLKKLLPRSEKLKNEFNESKSGKMRKILAAIASNATSWSKRLKKLNFDLLQKTYAQGEYPLWHRYEAITEAIDNGVPSPTQSDKCVGSLVESEENLSDDLNWRCEVPNECYKAIINGTDFGYWLTHRLILLVHARLSRNCAIFSAHEDELFRIEFCEKAYREAEYIAFNDFQIVDLFLEQIAVCALDGNAQFLRRSWLIRVLDYQQPNGCFQLHKMKSTDKPNIKDCNDHAMAVALGTFAAAVRFILETLKRLI